MTQLNQQNHYDIKYLRGSGSQVSVKNQRIVLKNGMDVFSGEQEIEDLIDFCRMKMKPTTKN